MKNRKIQKTTNNIKAFNNNIDFLKKHFSHCFDKNGNFDFEKFKKELSKNEIDFSKESYGMDWLGKSYARLLASDEATTLLKEDEEWNKKKENKNSGNLLIKGDNLEVLKHLSNAYYEKIKMIYIDPPYNTGSDGFVYQDDRKFTAEELSKLAGIDEEKAQRILDFVNSKSNSHSAWLTFMYPRLYIAKQLLRDDGVIFVSIDDNEVAQLRILMDEIFGEENFVAQLIWRKKSSGGQHSSTFLDFHEYILVYTKDNNNKPVFLVNRTDKQLKSFKLKDKYVKRRGNYLLSPLKSWLDERKTLTYEIECPDGSKIKNQWVCSKETYLKLLNEDRIVFKQNGTKWSIYKKQYSKENNGKVKPPSILLDIAQTQNGKRELKNLFNDKDIMNFPKPTKLMKYLVEMDTDNINNDLILDFFAGSGTTGDAVMQLNTEDGGNRKYILVQLPEEIDKNKNKTAYDFVKNELGVESPTIFEITKERLIRAAKKIKKESIKTKITEKEKEIRELESKLDLEDKEEKIKQLEKDIKNLKNQDLGFKIFETTPIWEDYNFEAEEFDPQTKLFDESKLTKEDLKTLLTTWKTYDGIALTEELKEIDLDGYKGFYYENKLYLMHKGFKTKNLKKLLEEIDENKDFNPATIIAFGYNFESKILREIAENVKNYANKKQTEDIDFIERY